MIDKYEEHNRRVLDTSSPHDHVVVINEVMYDRCEEEGTLHLLNKCVVSRPIKALVQYPGIEQRFRPIYKKIRNYPKKKIAQFYGNNPPERWRKEKE